jgi:hypothetical protein
MVIKLIIFAAIIALWIAGGQKKGKLRDIPVPILLGLGIGLFSHYILTPAIIFTAQTIRLGYGAYDPKNDSKPCLLARFTHDRQGCWVRALWGFLAAAGLPISIYTHNWLSYGVYICGNILINLLVSKLRLRVLITDILVSAGIGSLLFLF